MPDAFIQSIISGDSTYGAKSYEDDKKDFWDNILPPVVKDAYNRSITGMVDSMITGEQRFDMPTYHPSAAQDFTAMALSFLMPADIAATLIPGGIASKFAGKALAKGAASPSTRAAKLLMNKTNMKKDAAYKLVDDVIQYGATNSAALGVYDGLYSAAKAGSDEILKQGISLKHLDGKSEEEILSIIGKEGMKGLFKGASLGSIAAVARAMRWTGGYGAIPVLGKFQGTKAGGFLNETIAFGAASPLFDGRLPRAQDFILSGAVFSALKTAPAVKKAAGQLGAAVRKPIGDRTLSEGPIKYRTTLPDGTESSLVLETTDDVARLGAQAITDDIQNQITGASFSPVLGKEFYGLRKELLEKLKKQPIFFEDGKVNDKFKSILGPDVLARIQKATSLKATRQVPIQVAKPEKGLRTVREFQDDISGDIALGGLNEVRVSDILKNKSGQYTGEIRIRIGDANYYKLDAQNTEKFFNNYTSDGAILKNFQKFNNRKTVDELHSAVLQSRVKNIKQEDLALAISSADSNLHGGLKTSVSAPGVPNNLSKQLQNLNASGSIDPTKLSGIEKIYLNKYITGQKRYKEVYDRLSDIDKKNLTLRLENQNFFSFLSKQEERVSPIGAVLNGLKSGKFQLKTPGAKKLLRYLDVVDGEITVLQGQRLTSLAEVIDMHEMATGKQKLRTETLKNNQTWNEYIRGSQIVKGETIEPVYFLKRDMETKGAFTKIKKLIDSSTGQEKLFHQRRLDTLIELKRGQEFIRPGYSLKRIEELVKKNYDGAELGLLPRVYMEAKENGIPVAPYLLDFFPKRLKKDFIDTIFRNDGKIREEIIAQGHKKIANNIDSGLNDGEIAIVERIVKEYFTKIREAVAGKRQSGNLSKKDLLDESFLKMFTVTQAKMPGASNVDIYNAIRVGAYNNSLKPYASLEKRRKTAAERVADIDFVEMADELGSSAPIGDITRKTLGELSNSLVERDGLVVLSDYIVGASKRQILGGTFGRRGEVLDNLTRLIPEDAPLVGRLRLIDQPVFSAPQTERQAIELIRDVITGEINFTQATTSAEVFRKASNLEMIAKINLGFATIPNLTQTAISTMVDAGFWRTMRATHRLVTDADFRKEVVSFTTLQTLVDDMIGIDPGTQVVSAFTQRGEGAMSQFLSLFHKNNPDRISTLTSATDRISLFSKVNRMNQMVAGATSKVLMEDLRALAKGKKGTGAFSFLDKIAPEKRVRYAKNRLQALGFNMDEVLKDGFLDTQYGQKEMARVMNKYARDTQLQRSFEKDNILFNHPDFKPFLLFKRFGYRQAEFTYSVLKREWLNGNVMPILSVAATGIAGQVFVQPAKEFLQAALSGDIKMNDFRDINIDEAMAKRFNTRNKRVRFLRDGFGGVTFDNYLESLAAVGTFGMIGDFLASEDKWSTLKFIATPVFFSDLGAIMKSLETFQRKTETFYPSLYEPAVASLRQSSRIFGGVATQLSYRLETPKMEISRYKQTRKETITAAKDFIGSGQASNAAKLVDDYNKSIGYLSPELTIYYDDFSIWKIYEDLAKKQTKIEEEYETLEERMFRI